MFTTPSSSQLWRSRMFTMFSLMRFVSVFLTLGFSSESTNGFIVSRLKTSGATKTVNGFIRVGSHSSASATKPNGKPDFSVFVLPGTLVPPSSYESVCHQIKELCTSRNMTVDVSVAKFTLNAGHRFETECMSKKIKEEARSENIVIVGHSASAVVGGDIAKNVDAAGFVQWCGTFNANGDFPWDCVDPNKYDLPVMSILSEHDSIFSFPLSVREFCNFGNYTSVGDNVIPTSIQDAGHFSGVYTDDREFEDLPRRLQNTIESTGTSVEDLFYLDTVSVAWRVSEFIGYLNGSPEAAERVHKMKSDFRFKFGELASTVCNDDVKTMLYGESSTKHTHNKAPPRLLYGLLYATFPELRSLITLYTMVIPFIFSYPSESRSISVSSIMNPLPGATFGNPSIWAKIPYNGPVNFSQEVNSNTFEKALSEVSESDRQEYFKYGKPMVFADDTDTPKVLGCGLIWVSTPLVVNKEDSYVSVSSPVVKLDRTLNTKLISRKQCLEWILVGCFK